MTLQALKVLRHTKRVIELEKELRGAITELREICLNELKNDKGTKGVIDGAKEVA